MIWTVQLTRDEMDECRQASAHAVEVSKKRSKVDYTMGDEGRFKLIGAGGEKAFSILVGIEAEIYNYDTRDDGDVGGIEVKATENLSGRLPVGVRDEAKRKLSRPYVLCYHLGKGLFEFKGWHFGWYVKQFGNLMDVRSKNGNGARADVWMLDAKKLLPMDEIVCLARGVPVDVAVRDWDKLKTLI